MRYRPLFELLECRRLLASDWQNPLRTRDVDGDGYVTALDVLVGINRLNEKAGPLPLRAAQSTEPFYDVDGDSAHTPLDVLMIINAINNGPLVDVSLANDTGLGPNGNRDRLTRNIALNGTILGGATQLSAKLGPDGAWVDLSSELIDGKRFSLSEQSIAGWFPDSNRDGPLDFYFETKNSGTNDADSDRMRFQFNVDRQSPTIATLGQIQMDRSDQILIPILESIPKVTVDTTKIGVFDVTFGENSPNAPFGEELRMIAVTILSAQITDGGRKLALKLPQTANSARYRVFLADDAVTDAAGNPVRIGNDLYANYLAPNIPTLQFERGYLEPIAATSGHQILEYAFELPVNDRIVWGGDRFDGRSQFNGLSEFEIVDATGMRVWSVKSGQRLLFNTQGSVGVFPQSIPLAAGKYRLRMIETSVPGSFFWVSRESRLTDLPMSLSTEAYPEPELDTWSLHIHRIHLESGEILSVERGEATSATAEPLWRAISPTGNNVEVFRFNQTMRFAAQEPGDYIVALRDIPYVATKLPYLDVAPDIDPSWSDPPIQPGDDDRTIIDLGELPKGLIQLDFRSTKETLQFTVNAEAGNQYFLETLFYGFNSPISNAVLNENGSYLGDIDGFTAVQGGTYRFQFRSSEPFTHPIRVAELQELKVLVPGEIGGATKDIDFSSAFRFTSTQERFYAKQATPWQIFSVDGAFNTGRLTESKIDIRLEVGKEYVLKFDPQIRNHGYDVEIDLTYPIAKDIVVGESVSGSIGPNKASIVFSVQLEAGKRYRFAENEWPGGIWLDTTSIYGTPLISTDFWSVLKSGSYRFQTTNFSYLAVDYRFRLEQAPLGDQNLPIEGMGIELQGTLDPRNEASYDSYRVQMPKGTVVSIEMLEGSIYDFRYFWTTPSNLQQEAINNRYIAPESGEYAFKITSVAFQTRYRLKLRSPSQAPEKELNTTIETPISEQSNTIYQFKASEPTFVYLDWQKSSFGFMQYTNGFYHSYYATDIFRLDANDSAYVGAVPSSGVPLNFFAVRTFEPLPMGQRKSFDMQYRSKIGLEFDVADLAEYEIRLGQGFSPNIQLLDPNGKLTTSVGESILLVPGRYQLLLQGFYDSQDYSILVQNFSRVVHSIQTGQTVRDGLSQISQVNRYAIDAVAGQELVLITPPTYDSPSYVPKIQFKWIEPTTESHFVNNQSKLSVKRSGRYILEIKSKEPAIDSIDYSFSILDLASATVVGLGTSWVELSEQNRFGLLRLSGNEANSRDIRIAIDGQSLPLLDNSIRVYASNRSSVFQFDRAAIKLAKGDDLFVYLVCDRPVQVSLEDYVPRTFQAKLGELIESPSRFALDEIVVSFEIPSNGAYLLEMPNQSTLYDRAQRKAFGSRGGPLLNGVIMLLAGRYELRGTDDFVCRISSLAGDLPKLPIGQRVTVDLNSTFQVDIPRSGRYEFAVRDQDGRAIKGYTGRLDSANGKAFLSNPKVSLEQGAFWFRLAKDEHQVTAGKQYTLEFLPVDVTVQTGTLGRDLSFELSSQTRQEYVVTIPFAPKQRAYVAHLHLDPEVTLEYSLTGINGTWYEWNSYALAPGYERDFLHLRFSGTGSASIRLNDWRQAAFLNFVTGLSIPLSTEWQVWKLDVTKFDNLKLNVSDPGVNIGFLSLETEALKGMEVISRESEFSVVNQKTIYLIMRPSQPSDPLDVRLDLMKS